MHAHSSSRSTTQEGNENYDTTNSKVVAILVAFITIHIQRKCSLWFASHMWMKLCDKSLIQCVVVRKRERERMKLRQIGAGVFGSFMNNVAKKVKRFHVLEPFTRSSGLDWNEDVLSKTSCDATYVSNRSHSLMTRTINKKSIYLNNGRVK